jgi:hypothetical protein
MLNMTIDAISRNGGGPLVENTRAAGGSWYTDTVLSISVLEATNENNPTQWEEENLQRVFDNIPSTIFLVAVAELAERFTCQCITAPMRQLILQCLPPY